MALPELLMPASLPPFKADSHVITPDQIFVPVPMQGGSSRNRRVFTSVPRRLETALEVSQAALQDFAAWFEGPLLAGSVPFTAAISKIGTVGYEYQEAILLKYTAEHFEGNLHLITISLLLRGLPSASLPASTTLASETSVALLLSVDTGYAYGLSSETSAGLDITVVQGDLLSSEVVVHLYVESGGPQTGIHLDSETFVGLELIAVQLPSEAFDSEVSVPLLITFAPEISLSSEISVAMLLTFDAGGGAGYVAAPGDTAVSSTAVAPVTVLIQIRSDGTIYKKKNSDAYIFHANWYSPTTPSVGNLLWARATDVTGDPIAYGGVLALNVNRSWSITVNSGVTDGTIRIDIATDPDMLNIVSSFQCELYAEAL